MQILVAVAEEGGFAPAAKRLGMSPPAVTRAVAALEEHLGVRLFRRTTRVVRLTEAGTRFLADGRRILEELAEAEVSATGAHSVLRGEISVTAPSMFGRLFVAPIAIDFLARHSEVGVRTLLVDRVVNLVEEGLDVAVRIAHLPDSSLTSIHVGSMRHVVCAAPSYLAARRSEGAGRPHAHGGDRLLLFGAPAAMDLSRCGSQQNRTPARASS
jgi:DNA-binding transcriptional LysR family regulator